MKPPDPAASRLIVQKTVRSKPDTATQPDPPQPEQSAEPEPEPVQEDVRPLNLDDFDDIMRDLGFGPAEDTPSGFTLPFTPEREVEEPSILDRPGIVIPAHEDLMVSAFEEASDPKVDRWLRDPAAWVTERVNGFLWSKQRIIMQSLNDHKSTAVHTCHNVGKSFVAALAACWWIDSHPPGSAFVITTAPTGAQVKAILWRYINRIHAAHDLIGRLNLVEWYIGQEMVAFGRKPSDYTPDAFQGIHAEYVLAIIDEACGVDQVFWDDMSTMTSNRGSRTLAIGNPDDPTSYFQKVCTPGSGWNVIGVSAFETPNFTDEVVPPEIERSLIAKEWAEDRANVWGIDSPIYISKVLGEFPVDSEDGVIPGSFVAGCRVLADEKMNETPVVLGVDVGDTTDRTVVVERHGQRVHRVYTIDHRSDSMNAVGEIAAIAMRTGAESIVIDVIGLGWGVYGRLKELSRADNPTEPKTTHNARLIRFSAAETAHNAEKFINKRAELWWEVGRENSRLKLWDLTAITDDVAAELTAPKYALDGSKGRIVVESKKDIRKRLGRSPDVADALLMAFYPGDGRSNEGRLSDFNRQLAETSLFDDDQNFIGIMGPR